MAKNAKSGKIICRVEQVEDGRIAEIYEVNMPMSVKHLTFNELIKWSKNNPDSNYYIITYDKAKHSLDFKEWLGIQKELKFINNEYKILK